MTKQVIDFIKNIENSAALNDKMPNRFSINIENNQNIVVSFKNNNITPDDLPQVKNEFFIGVDELKRYLEIGDNYHELRNAGMGDFTFDVAENILSQAVALYLKIDQISAIDFIQCSDLCTDISCSDLNNSFCSVIVLSNDYLADIVNNNQLIKDQDIEINFVFDKLNNTGNVIHDYSLELYKDKELMYTSEPIVLPIEDKFDKEVFIQKINEEINNFLKLNNVNKKYGFK